MGLFTMPLVFDQAIRRFIKGGQVIRVFDFCIRLNKSAFGSA